MPEGIERIPNYGLNGSISPDKCHKLKRAAELSELLYGVKDELTLELEALQK